MVSLTTSWWCMQDGNINHENMIFYVDNNDNEDDNIFNKDDANDNNKSSHGDGATTADSRGGG